MQNLIKRISVPFARISLFVIYFWFGLLKILGQSGASEMVKSLFDLTIANYLKMLSFDQFILCFAILEMLIGLLFLFKFDRIAIILLIVHLATTAIPLYMLRDIMWAKSLVPTLEGQYVIKNLALLGLGLFVYSRE